MMGRGKVKNLKLGSNLAVEILQKIGQLSMLWLLAVKCNYLFQLFLLKSVLEHY